jgi:hypothetical protein
VPAGVVTGGKTIAVVCALVLCAGGLAACGEKGHEKDPTREGLEIPLGGLEYNVFITRQLNTEIPPDQAYYKGPQPPKGQTLYGVFIQVCNRGKTARPSTEEFEIVDNQGNHFKPRELEEDNDFAYHARTLDPQKCIPEAGSVAQLGPTAGSLLMFQLPLAITENRPLELEIKQGDEKTPPVELDI